MELEEFIRTSLISIYKGVRRANEEIAKLDGKTLGKDKEPTFVLEPRTGEKWQSYISFDIAVTVTQETGKAGGGSVKIVVVSLGGEAESKAVYESISRIKFYVAPFKYYIG
jgi:hypothetical protein